MNESTRQGGNTSRLAAAAVAATIALGLLSAPAPADTAVTRQALTIHTQTIAVDLTAVAAQISPTTTAAATPKADAAGVDPNSVARVAALIALTPLWYAAFPITLPATVGVMYFTLVAISCISACGVGLDPVNALKLGIEAWALGPVNLIQSELKGIVPHSSSATATPSAARTASLSTPPQTARHARGAKPGIANSLPKAKSGRAPSAEAKAKRPPTSSDKKRTAGSGRSADKH